jgi:hypothetical protein
MRTNEFMLVGGPRDGELTTADRALLEVEIDGMLHRYVQTHATRDHDGQEYGVYNYDGMVDPRGAESGVEDAGARLASPTARDDR